MLAPVLHLLLYVCECSADDGPISFVSHTTSNDDVSCDMTVSGDAQLRRRVMDDKTVETVGPMLLQKSKQLPVKDPLKWFGLLVPPSLRTAQKNFTEGKQLIFFC